MTVLVGGVSELFQGDLDLGRLVVQRLQTEDLGPDVLVEELHYGAVAVAQRLEDMHPDRLVLVAAVQRGRAPGTVERRRIQPADLTAADLQAAVGEAVVGYVHVDLVVDVAAGFGVLPPRTVTIEVEPEQVGPGEGLSASAEAGLATALMLVRDEVRRAPLMQLAEQVRPLLAGDRLEESPALCAVRALLAELRHLDRDGRWGAAFALRDRLKLGIAAGRSSEGMDHRDWALWWALIEELDRLEMIEAATPMPDHPTP
jgi:Ni,Fe-hydrogenase maturation factor